ncbi:MAG: hypothetical protein K6E18_09295 [Lachnospiraceae bacterium]|nr:hypothetical protein [Lachnospiraceae bacterium]
MEIVNLMENTEGAPGCFYEHGLSFYIETSAHRVLFDLGQTELFARNAKILGSFPIRYYTCHCTGIPAYDEMKRIMGDQLAYVHAGMRISIA